MRRSIAICLCLALGMQPLLVYAADTAQSDSNSTHVSQTAPAGDAPAPANVQGTAQKADAAPASQANGPSGHSTNDVDQRWSVVIEIALAAVCFYFLIGPAIGL